MFVPPIECAEKEWALVSRGGREVEVRWAISEWADGYVRLIAEGLGGLWHGELILRVIRRVRLRWEGQRCFAAHSGARR